MALEFSKISQYKGVGSKKRIDNFAERVQLLQLIADAAGASDKVQIYEKLRGDAVTNAFFKIDEIDRVKLMKAGIDYNYLLALADGDGKADTFSSKDISKYYGAYNKTDKGIDAVDLDDFNIASSIKQSDFKGAKVITRDKLLNKLAVKGILPGRFDSTTQKTLYDTTVPLPRISLKYLARVMNIDEAQLVKASKKSSGGYSVKKAIDFALKSKLGENYATRYAANGLPLAKLFPEA